MKKLLSALFLLGFSLGLFGATLRAFALEEESETELVINCNVEAAEVYVNGSYEGRTNLIIENLRPGVYEVEVKKRGYCSLKEKVEVIKGYKREYSFTLEKAFGRISVINLEASELYVDGALVGENSFEADCGNHTLEIKGFGYEPFKKNVLVEEGKVSEVYVEYTEALFNIEDFKVSRKKINPNGNALWNKSEISFKVTASKPARLEIINNESVVWSYEWSGFSSWNQSVLWDGTSDGVKLSDGNYLVKLSSENLTFTETITLDSSKNKSLTGITKSGSGIGGVSFAMNTEPASIVPYFGFAAQVDLNGSSGSFFDVSTGVLMTLLKHYEFNVGASYNPYFQNKVENHGSVNFSFKAYGASDFEKLSVCYGASGHWGLLNGKENNVFGFDRGHGLGAAVSFGLDFSKVYGGFASDLIFAAGNGLDFNSGIVLKNSFALNIKPWDFVNVNTWVGLNSAFNTPGLSEQYDDEVFRALNFGAEVIFMFGNLPLSGSIKYDSNYVLFEGYYFSAGFGLSYSL